MPPTRALITGINGFAGSHLADLLLSLGFDVSGTIRPFASRSNLQHSLERVQLHECDICHRDRMCTVVAIVRPDLVFHLAAKTQEKDTRHDPLGALETNVLGTIHVFEALLAADLVETRVLVAGSSAEYGRVSPADQPIREEHPFNPASMYGVTKIAQGMTAVQYHLTRAMPIVRTRAFNYTGPRQTHHFAIPAFARQIAEIEAGLRGPVLKVGDLSHRRDMSDVRDVVRGYHAALTGGIPGEVYNIAAGSAAPTRELLDRLLAMSNTRIEVTLDPERLRPGDVAAQVGDAGKLTRQTGWRPQVPLEQTLRDTLDYWRDRVARQGAEA